MLTVCCSRWRPGVVREVPSRSASAAGSFSGTLAIAAPGRRQSAITKGSEYMDHRSEGYKHRLCSLCAGVAVIQKGPLPVCRSLLLVGSVVAAHASCTRTVTEWEAPGLRRSGTTNGAAVGSMGYGLTTQRSIRAPGANRNGPRR